MKRLRFIIAIILLPTVVWAADTRWDYMAWDQDCWDQPCPRGNITGIVVPAITMQVMLEGSGYTTAATVSGTFNIQNIPSGTYNLVISSPHFQSVNQQVTVTNGQTLQLNNLPSVPMSCNPGDVTGDGKLGLEDIIYGLQVLADIRK